jgi:hypothetical protein
LRRYQAINGVDGMLYLRSASAGNGALAMTVTFAIGTDPDLAAINVNNRVQSMLSTLPEEVRRQGVQVRKRSTSMLKIFALDSDDPRFDSVFISNYALLNVVDELRVSPAWRCRFCSKIIHPPAPVMSKLGLTLAMWPLRFVNRTPIRGGRIGQNP